MECSSDLRIYSKEVLLVKNTLREAVFTSHWDTRPISKLPYTHLVEPTYVSLLPPQFRLKISRKSQVSLPKSY